MESGPYDSGTTCWRRSGRLALSFKYLNCTLFNWVSFCFYFVLLCCNLYHTCHYYCISVTSINFSLVFSLVFNIFLKDFVACVKKMPYEVIILKGQKFIFFHFQRCTGGNYAWMVEILVYLAWCPLTTAKKSMPLTRVKQETNIQLKIKIKAEIKVSANTLPNLFRTTHITSTFGQLRVISHSHYI